MKRLTLLMIILSLFLGLPLQAIIIDIPDDYPTIQQGINASTDGDTVLVQPGTYVENINFNGHNIVLGSLFLTTGDTTYIAVTVIDGDSAGSVVTFENTEDSTATIRGFTLQGGYAYYGAGISSYNSDPIIANNIIKNNEASRGGAGIDCYISDALITDNKIIGNNSHLYGGGINCNGSRPTIFGNLIEGNAASYGSGIFCKTFSNPIIANNVIRGNLSSEGGSIYCVYSNPTVTNNRIVENAGGGIYFRNSEPAISGNVISGNIGSGIILYLSDSVIRQNVIIGNHLDDYGAGIWCDNSYPEIINNSIAYNSYSQGGGVYCWYCSPTIINTIIWGNTSSISRMGDSIPDVRYCDVQGGYAGEGNIDSNPLFTGLEDKVFNVCSNSPCINAGDPVITDPDGSRSDIGVFYAEHEDCISSDKWFVSVSGDDIYGDGSEGNPFRTIQHGIESAIHGDTVIVENGTYLERIHFSGKNIVLSSRYIYSLNQWDILNTIIGGDSGGTVVTFEYGEDQRAALIGFTITDGSDCGIRCYHSSPVLTHNRIIANTGYRGAGINCEYSDAVISFNDISNNISTSDQGYGGGGLYLFESDIRINNNIISNNITGGRGGGIHCLRSNPTVNNNIIYSNDSYLGGGIYCGAYSMPVFINDVIYGNSAYWGGGFYNDFNTNPEIINCIFWADSALYGNEIFLYEGSIDPRYCDVQGGWGGVGMIDADPLFRDASNEDFHLMSANCGYPLESPCIDTGDPDSLDASLDCAWGLGTIRSDMGAYGGGDSLMVGLEEEDGNLPSQFRLSQNYPNPFNGETTIRYEIPYDADISLVVYDVLGRKVKTLVDEFQPVGMHTIVWEADSLSSGIYLYRLDSGGHSELEAAWS